MRGPRTYCTLFDSAYLPKGLALHASLRRHDPRARLVVCCFDDRTRDMLEALALPDVELLPLAALEAADPDLASVRAERTPVEYCWTATPALPRHLLAREGAPAAVTYLDADLWFASSPEPLFAEAGDASVVITEHGFAPEYAHHAVNGLYNVQFMTFRADVHGRAALDWWHDRCVEWCGAVPEAGRFGDQKYLDDWPERFPGVHVLAHPGAGLAPWNARARRIAAPGGEVTVDGAPLVFAHLHGLRLRSAGRPRLHPPGYRVPPAMRDLVYLPYLAELEAARRQVLALDPSFAADLEPPPSAAQRLRAAREVLGERVLSATAHRRREVAR